MRRSDAGPLQRSKAFVAALGFTLDPDFSGETAACMVVGEQASVVLGSHETFAQYSHRPMADPTTHALAFSSFNVQTREEVDTVAAAALAAGGVEADGREDHGSTYSRSSFDLDGHGWQVTWMNPAAAQQGAAEFVVAAQ